MLGVPSRETVAGLVMLAHVAFANGEQARNEGGCNTLLIYLQMPSPSCG
jgi:hypothetical protein